MSHDQSVSPPTSTILRCLHHLESISVLVDVSQGGETAEWFCTGLGNNRGEELAAGFYALWHNAIHFVANALAASSEFREHATEYSRVAAGESVVAAAGCYGASYHELAVNICGAAIYKVASVFRTRAEIVLWLEGRSSAKNPPAVAEYVAEISRWEFDQEGAERVLRSGDLPRCDMNWLRAGLRKEAARVEGASGTSGDPVESDTAHSDDFRSLRWFGVEYTFTPAQAVATRVLFEHWQRGTPDVGDDTLLHAIDHAAPPSSVRAVFRGSEAWQSIIVPGATKGTHRLKAPDNRP